MQTFLQENNELLLLANVMYGLLLLQSTAGSSQRESKKGKTGETDRRGKTGHDKC